jgi:hypothetical protein
MKQIRNGVFETNSSSTHSITITLKEDKFIDPQQVYSNVVSFGKYGWESERYDTPNEKLNYVFTLIQYHLDEEIEYTAREEYDSKVALAVFSSKYFKWLKELFFEYTGKELSVEYPCKGYCPLGYVDGRSSDILDEWWAKDEKKFKENMKDFIFNKKYGFVTDNDNH